MVRWQGTRYCVLNCGGKEKVFSVDRLSKHQQWDEIHPNTYKWELQAHVLERKRRNLLKGSSGQDSDDEDIEEEDGWIKENPQAGDIVVFNVKASKENPLQFGLGLIKEISIGEKGKIHFQWMGNFKMQESKPFLPCWEDSKKVIYYKNSPQHKSHKGVMGRDTQTKIKIQDAIMIGEKDGILNSINQKIHSKVLNQIKEHLLKAQAEEAQNATKKSQRRKNE
jgi:hypothetical protein